MLNICLRNGGLSQLMYVSVIQLLIIGNKFLKKSLVTVRLKIYSTFSPTHVPYKANIQALKDEGCTHVIATSACGSLNEAMAPGHVVLIDQFIDWTTKRPSTYFDSSMPPQNANETEEKFFSRVTHISTAEPFCPRTRQILRQACDDVALPADRFHPAGTMITIEGPRLSSRAESKMFRVLGADLINMTTCPEAALAKEAGLCYATIATVTDYDSWRAEGEVVTVEMIKNNAKKKTRTRPWL